MTALAIPVSSRQPRQFRLVRHALVLAKRNIIKITRAPEQLIDVTLQPVIFLLLFYYVFGGAIMGGSAGESRHDYLQFLVPGLLGQLLAMSSIAIGQNMNADIANGVFDRFRSLPIGRAIPLIGAVAAEFFRYLMVFLINVGFGYLLGFRITTSPLALLAALGLCVSFALAFAWLSIWVGMIVRTAGSVQGIMMLLVLPLKIKWLAWITLGLLGYQFLVGGWDFRMATLVCLGNYLIFFGGDHLRAVHERSGSGNRREKFRRQVQEVEGEALHECVVCKRTDVTSPELEFRVARDGQEYCREHLPPRVEPS